MSYVFRQLKLRQIIQIYNAHMQHVEDKPREENVDFFPKLSLSQKSEMMSIRGT